MGSDSVQQELRSAAELVLELQTQLESVRILQLL